MIKYINGIQTYGYFLNSVGTQKQGSNTKKLSIEKIFECIFFHFFTPFRYYFVTQKNKTPVN